MKIHCLRNATLIIQVAGEQILVDPLLGPPGTLPPLAFFRHRARRNPIVPLPDNAAAALESVTAALITHCRFGHRDHLDGAGERFLAGRQIPVYGNQLDAAYLKKRGIEITPLRPGEKRPFLNGHITPFKTAHGYGLLKKLMGPGLGYLLELPGEPRLYLSGDTVLTPTVREVLTEQQPDVAVVAAGSASLDVGRPILMPLEEILEFIRLAPGHVIANHLEALNHCPTSRTELRQAVTQAGLAEKVSIPEDGETITL